MAAIPRRWRHEIFVSKNRDSNVQECGLHVRECTRENPLYKEPPSLDCDCGSLLAVF
jgi:hypothetical protein